MVFTCTRGLAVALAAAFVVTAPSADAALSPGRGAALVEEIGRYRAEVWRWEHLMGKPRTPVPPAERTARSETALRSIRDVWERRAGEARKRASNPPHLSAWRCIHRYEGPWRDPDAPYYGGLQMDIAFQRTYAPALLRRKGTADRWTPLEQMWVAERALRAGRGFHPWPTAARRCGLI